MKQNLILFLFIFILSQNSFSQTIRERIKERRELRSNQQQYSSDAPVYSDLFYWAAHPAKHDNSDSIPSFLKDEKRDTGVDVFFLHPTTYTKDFLKASVNADINDTAVNAATDREILMQPTVFNGSCRIFAPRYRQAHLKNYFKMKSPEAKQGFDLAYTDLKNAFQYYLEHDNNGRPIIIAGHSQGSMHAVRLLQDFFDGKPLQKQLVCAYVVGWQIKKDEFKSLPFCSSPSQTGCVAGWRTYKKDHIDPLIKREDGNSLCINPISWTTDTSRTTKQMQKGALGKDYHTLLSKTITAAIAPGLNIVWVDIPPFIQQAAGMAKMENLHIADYNLFWMDIRENVKERVANFHP